MPIRPNNLAVAVILIQTLACSAASAQLEIIDSTRYVEMDWRLQFANPGFPAVLGELSSTAPDSEIDFDRRLNFNAQEILDGTVSQHSSYSSGSIEALGTVILNDPAFAGQIQPGSTYDAARISATSFFSVTFANNEPFEYELYLNLLAAETANPMEAHASLIRDNSDVVFDYTLLADQSIDEVASGVLPAGTWTLEAWITAEANSRLDLFTNGGGLFDILLVPTPGSMWIGGALFTPCVCRRRR